MVAAIPFHLPGFQIEQVEEKAEVLEIRAQAVTATGVCPHCGQASSQVQSRYTRQPRDLPSSGKRVQLFLKVRRFFCRNPACPCRIFCERVPQVLLAYARRTSRCSQTLTHIAFAVGGEGGARLAHRLGIPISPDTLLRLVRLEPAPAVVAPRVVGIDDWAFRRGYKYGTMICDLERSRPIELLPDRETASVAAWLKKHPSVELVTRDRSEAYGCAVSSGAPQAIQIADRWHLLNNLIDAAEEVLARHQAHLTRLFTSAQREPQDTPNLNRPEEALALPPTEWQVQKSQQNRAQRLARYNQVVELQQKGLKFSLIAQKVGISEQTVNRWLAAGHFPEHKRRRRQPSLLNNHLAYLNRRWAEGCHNATQLCREIRQQGYRGSQALVLHYAWRRRRELPIHTSNEWQPSEAKPLRIHSYSPRQAAILFVSPPEKLAEETQRDLTTMRQRCGEIRQLYELSQRFAQLIRQRQVDGLEPWLQAAQDSLLPELRQFVSGLLSDKAEVIAALKYPWSNGPVEGHINRLKLIKRQMFGRANFDLLRIRVLHPP